jgi:hypothetical protein
MNTFLELIVTIGRFLVGLWPLMFLAVLVGVFKLKKGFGVMLRTSIKALVVSWGFFAVLNALFYFFKMDTFLLLPKDLNIRLFFSVGLILLPFEVAILMEERYRKVKADTLEEMKKLSPADFERLVAETYRDQGHQVDIVGQTGDHGIDLVVHTRKGETWLVQCKKYRGKVGEPIIRDFYGAIRAANADAGAVITTGTITGAARLWAEGKPIFLYDGEEFMQVIQTTHIRKSLPPEAKKRPVVTPPAAAPAPVVMQPAYAAAAAAPVEAMPIYMPAPVKSVEPMVESVTADPYPPQDKRPFMNADDIPVCPACGVPMLLQTEKRLFQKPHELYICQNAPACDETIPVE